MSDYVLELDAFVRAIAVDRGLQHSLFLGAGASISSGIPSAEVCIQRWKRDLFVSNHPGLEKQFSEISLPAVRERIQVWLDDNGSYPPSDSPSEYSFYIEKCYPLPQHRQQFFANIVREAKPHLGYRMLGLLAEADLIKSAWTTNFDGLVTRALADSSIIPIEVGIDTQDRVVRQPRVGELLSVALHGDYRYDNLKNTPNEIQSQEELLRKALVAQLNTTSMIVLGYSGRDRSIMEAFEEAFTQAGTTNLYWCTYGTYIPAAVNDLMVAAQSSGRNAYLVHTDGFDDVLSRLALHCFTGDLHDRAVCLMSDYGEELREINDPFSIDDAKCSALIKSNAFEITCPSEVFAFELKKEPHQLWTWLSELTKDKSIVAVPHQGKILTLGLLDQIQDTFEGQIKGSIRRIPVTDTDKFMEFGQINALMLRVLLKLFTSQKGLHTDDRRVIWSTDSPERRFYGNTSYLVHKATTLHLRIMSGRQHLIIKPTVVIMDESGFKAPIEISKILKSKYLGYQHNAKFNQALQYWRRKLIPGQGAIRLEFPKEVNSSIRFRIRTSPVFARIGARRPRRVAVVSDNIKPLVKQSGLQIPEPTLLFAHSGNSQSAQDTHPLRGLAKNLPYDYSLTSRGLATRIRVGVISPVKEAKLFSTYLSKSGQRLEPSQTERDYLIDFPGFASVFHLPLELPHPGDPTWVDCPDPHHGSSSKEGALSLAETITRSIDALHASEKPHVIMVLIPDRWASWRNFQDNHEYFDLHDFVKAYCVQRGIATQFLEEHTTRSEQQCRIWWWLSVALYAKSMRTPWILEKLDPHSAFVGLGFAIDRSAPIGSHIVLGCSHLYNSQGEGMQFRLSKIENPIMIRKNPHMSYDDARRLGESIRQLFYESHLKLPERVVIHKQTRYLRDEKNGLIDGLGGIALVDLIEICEDASLRYVSSVQKSRWEQGEEKFFFDEDNFPVRRGTTIQIGSRKALLYCHGVTDAVKQGLKYFQGKRHIPTPLRIQRYAGKTSLEALSAEILGLSKMDWNSADMYSRLPATINSSKKIARIGNMLRDYRSISYDYRLFM